MKQIVLRGKQLPGGLWELELEGTRFRAGGGTLREAFEKLLELVFEEALRVATRELE